MISVLAGTSLADGETLTAVHTARSACSPALVLKGLVFLSFPLLSVPLDSSSSGRKSRAGQHKTVGEGSKPLSDSFIHPFPSFAC